jgi:hypothetical protein
MSLLGKGKVEVVENKTSEVSENDIGFNVDELEVNRPYLKLKQKVGKEIPGVNEGDIFNSLTGKTICKFGDTLRTIILGTTIQYSIYDIKKNAFLGLATKEMYEEAGKTEEKTLDIDGNKCSITKSQVFNVVYKDEAGIWTPSQIYLSKSSLGTARDINTLLLCNKEIKDGKAVQKPSYSIYFDFFIEKISGQYTYFVWKASNGGEVAATELKLLGK